MLKKLLAALGTLALVAGIIALVAGPASAHNYSVAANCAAGVSVNLTNYSTQNNNSTPNTVTVVLDGTTLVDHVKFGSSYSYTHTWPAQALSHTAHVTVAAIDDPTGANNWSFDVTKNAVNCTQSVTPAEVKHTDPYCLGAGTIGDGGYTIPAGQTAVTYQVETGASWADIAPATYPAAPGATVHIKAIPSSAIYTLTGQQTWDFTIGTIDASKCVVPVAPTSDDSRCTSTAGSSSPATYTIPTVASNAGYKFYLEGSGTPLTGGVVTVSTFPTTVVIVAKTTGDYVFPNGTTIKWTFTFASPGDCHVDVTPAAVVSNPAACTAPGVSSNNGYTITLTPGVIYHLSTNATPLTAGFHSLGSGAGSVEIQATAEPHYVLTGTVDWPFTFVAATDCLVKAPAGDPKFHDATCDVTQPGVIPLGTYQVLVADHVHYEASVNGKPFTKLDALTIYTANPGDVVVIKVIADQGYVVSPAILNENLSHTFAAVKGDCLVKTDFVKPAATSQSCIVTGTDDGLTPATTGDTSTSALSIRSLGSSAVNATLTAAVTPSVKSVVTHTLIKAFITIPSTPHVQYFINDVLQTKPGDVILDPGTYKVSAAAETGYVLDGYDGPWDEVLTSAAPCSDLITHPLVFPLASQHQLGCFANGSYTLSNSINDAAALTWTVNGSTVSPGTYTVGAAGTVTVHAAANGPAYGLESGAQTDWTFHFERPTSCDLTTLALTGSTPTGWIIFGYAMLVSGLALVALRFARRRDEQA